MHVGDDGSGRDGGKRVCGEEVGGNDVVSGELRGGRGERALEKVWEGGSKVFVLYCALEFVNAPSSALDFGIYIEI